MKEAKREEGRRPVSHKFRTKISLRRKILRPTSSKFATVFYATHARLTSHHSERRTTKKGKIKKSVTLVSDD